MRRRLGVARILGGATLLVALALAGAAGTAAAGSSDTSTGEEPSTSIPPPAKPLEAKLARLEGGAVHLSAFRGQPVLLDLWATWCLPCRQQSRILRDLSEEIAARGVHLIAIDIGEKPSVVREFLATSQSEGTVLLDRSQTLPRRLGIDRLPAVIALRSDGHMASGRLGVARRDEVLALLDAAAGGGSR